MYETLPTRLKKLTAEQVERSVRMYESGASIAPIACEMKVSRQAMWDLLRRRTKMRPQKRYGKSNHFYRGVKNTGRRRAQKLLWKAIQSGRVIRPAVCPRCKVEPSPFRDGRSAIQGHHKDYSKPLEVEWLCQRCHHEEHKIG